MNECNLSDNKPLQFRDIITLFIYMYNNNIDNRFNILSTIFRNRTKLYLCLGFGYKITDVKQFTRKTILQLINNKLEYYAFIFNLKATKRKIRLVQKLWREYMSKISGSNLGYPINAIELFTFDDIDEIEYPFYLIDETKVYIFESLNLLYHIKTNKLCINPYTNNKITDDVIDRLYHYIYIKEIYLDDEEYKWLTTINAYTDISLKLDKLGYYNDIRWFMTLDYYTILNVLNSFHSYVIGSSYMCCIDFSDEYPDYIYKFCEMILEMLEDNDASTYGFILFKSLSDNSKVFSRNCPNWLEI
tara:strand:+ start:822 stop:1727 length:906 start_codon:yes stop_codon:yes gene_type:complete